jgi:hypothetical protein
MHVWKQAAFAHHLPTHCMQIHSGDMLDVWAETAPLSALSTFNAFPSNFSTSVCECLMAMPPLLEVLVDESSESEEQVLAASWLDKVASALASDLQAQVLTIPKLGCKVLQCPPVNGLVVASFCWSHIH